MQGDKELQGKIEIRCYKEVINPNLENQNLLSFLTNVKKKMNISKIRKICHDLHSETRQWLPPKTTWDERVCHL